MAELAAVTDKAIEKGIGVWEFDGGGIKDWVAAQSEEEAVAFYQAETGVTRTDYDLAQVGDLDAYLFNVLDEPAGKDEQGRVVYAKVSVRKSVQDNLLFPVIIASTEH